MLEKIENKVVEKIKELDLKPQHKSFFVMRRFLLWFLVAIFLILGGISVSLIATILRFGDWDIYSRITDGFVIFVILTFPYVWLIFFIIFMLLAFWEFRKTRRGYKHGFVAIFSFSCVLVALLGALFYASGIGREVENFLADNFSSYGKVNYMRGVWNSPEKGMLAGEIISIEKRAARVKDFSGSFWAVDLAKAEIAPMVQLSSGSKIKIIGKISLENNFIADEVRPWKCGCPHCSGNSGPSCPSCGNGECSQDGQCQAERKY